MFGRQWFSETSQFGLTSEALEFEEMLVQRNFPKAFDIINLKQKPLNSYWKRQSRRICHLLLRNPKKPITLYYDSFWPNMVAKNCQLTYLLRLAASSSLSIDVTNDPSEADISLYSCYGNLSSLPRTQHTYRILFLGENVRPCYSEFDLSLTSDINSYFGRNINLPLWMLEIDWFGMNYPDREPLPLSEFISEKVYDPRMRLHSIAFVGNNFEPFRISVIQQLIQSGFNVDLYGSHSRPVDNKIDLYRRYRAVLCPENSFFPGYVTEKLLHSFASCAFSIYWGCLDGTSFMDNPHILKMDHYGLNSQDMTKLREFLESDDVRTIRPLFTIESAEKNKKSLLERLSMKLSQFIS